MTTQARGRGDRADAFAEDPRYAVSRREMWISVAYWASFSAATVVLAWVLGGGKSADEIRFVLGFPAWFFWSCIVCSLFFSAIPYFIVKRWFTRMPLTTDGSDESDDPTGDGGEQS